MLAMPVKPINLKFHAAWLLLLAGSGLYACTQVGQTLGLWTAQRQTQIAHQQQVQQIQHQAELTQAAIDNHINLYDSVTLTDYVCDPEAPPSFDAQPFAKPDQLVKVSDRLQRVVGYIDTSGRFHFHPAYCRLSNN
jgi:hypothetical protein